MIMKLLFETETPSQLTRSDYRTQVNPSFLAIDDLNTFKLLKRFSNDGEYTNWIKYWIKIQ